MQRINNRNYNLDLMRIIACVAVVGLHTLQKDLSIVNSSLYYMCGFAVPVFFMASGYIILNREQITLRYSIGKIRRIFMRVISWSALFFAAKLLTSLAKYNLEKNAVWLFPQFVARNLIQKESLGHLWYLGALVIIYALSPVLKRFGKYLCYIWSAFFIIGCTMQVCSYIWGEALQSHCIQTFRLWTWVQYFILGGIYGGGVRTGKKIEKILKYIQNMNGHISVNRLMLITSLIVTYYNIMGRYFLHNLYAEYFYDSFITVMWVSILFNWIMKINLSDKMKEMVKFFSPLTMGVYIIHPILIKIFVRFWVADTILSSLLYFSVILLISVFMTWVIYKISLTRWLIEL